MASMESGGKTREDEKKDDGQNWEPFEPEDVEIGDQIGGGGAALVHQGRLVRDGRDVALKTLFDPHVSDTLKKDYMDELQVMSKLAHPNIVEFIGACLTPPRMFFVMELCQDSIFGLLHHRRHGFSVREKIEIAKGVALGMAYLHAQDPCIIHRDLKTHNVLLALDGHVKLCDFGLVRTRNTSAGTPAYMAPELFQRGHFSRKVDIFSFAVFLWELFTGEIPHASKEVAEIREMICEGRRLSVPTVDTPDTIRDLMQDCWADDPDSRPDFYEIAPICENAGMCHQDSYHAEAVGGGDALDDLLG